jgi:hypothetical protein
MMNADKLNEMMRRLKALDVEWTAYLKAMPHADDTQREAMAAHVDELFRERCRIMGLPEDEIARIEQESEQAVDQQIADEIKQTVDAVAKARQEGLPPEPHKQLAQLQAAGEAMIENFRRKQKPKTED